MEDKILTEAIKSLEKRVTELEKEVEEVGELKKPKTIKLSDVKLEESDYEEIINGINLTIFKKSAY